MDSNILSVAYGHIKTKIKFRCLGWRHGARARERERERDRERQRERERGLGAEMFLVASLSQKIIALQQ